MNRKRINHLHALAGAAWLFATLSVTGCHDRMWRDGYIPPYPDQPAIPQVAMPQVAPSASPTGPSLAFRAPGDAMPGWKEDSGKINPTPGDADSIKRGADAFGANCAICHGPQGKGDGANATFLPLRPRNLTEGVFLYGGEDWQLYRTVSEGIPPGPMLAWKSVLDDKSIWDVVNYVKSLRSVAASPAGSASGAAASPTTGGSK